MNDYLSRISLPEYNAGLGLRLRASELAIGELYDVALLSDSPGGLRPFALRGAAMIDTVAESQRTSLTFSMIGKQTLSRITTVPPLHATYNHDMLSFEDTHPLYVIAGNINRCLVTGYFAGRQTDYDAELQLLAVLPQGEATPQL